MAHTAADQLLLRSVGMLDRCQRRPTPRDPRLLSERAMRGPTVRAERLRRCNMPCRCSRCSTRSLPRRRSSSTPPRATPWPACLARRRRNRSRTTPRRGGLPGPMLGLAQHHIDGTATAAVLAVVLVLGLGLTRRVVHPAVLPRDVPGVAGGRRGDDDTRRGRRRGRRTRPPAANAAPVRGGRSGRADGVAGTAVAAVLCLRHRRTTTPAAATTTIAPRCHGGSPPPQIAAAPPARLEAVAPLLRTWQRLAAASAASAAVARRSSVHRTAGRRVACAASCGCGAARLCVWGCWRRCTAATASPATTCAAWSSSPAAPAARSDPRRSCCTSGARPLAASAPRRCCVGGGLAWRPRLLQCWRAPAPMRPPRHARPRIDCPPHRRTRLRCARRWRARARSWRR